MATPFISTNKYKIMTIVEQQNCWQWFCQDRQQKYGIYITPTEIYFHDMLEDVLFGSVYIRSFTRYADIHQPIIIFMIQSNKHSGNLTTQLQITFSANTCDIYANTMNENTYIVQYTNAEVIDRICYNMEKCYEKYKDLIM